MDFSKPLLLKGLGGIAAAGTVGGGVVFGRNMMLKNQEEKDKVREGVNVKLETLGLKEDCRLGKEDDPYTINKECDLDLEKLKKIKFSNKGDGDLVVKSSSGTFPEGLKLKFERKNKEEDISFSFTGLAEGSDIKIFGDESKGKIILKSSTPEQKFKEERGMLEKDSSGVDAELKAKLEDFNKQLGTVKAPIECRFDEAEAEESVECGVTQDDLIKTLKFSGLGEGELTVKGQVPGGLRLKVERKDKEDISLSFTGVTSDIKLFGDKTKGKIVIKSDGGNNKKFKVKENKLTKGDSDENLKTFNEQLGTINAPIECRFDEAETDTSVECPITQGELKLMEFSNKGTGNLTVKDWPSAGTVNLKVEKEAQNAISLSFTGLTNGSDIKVFGDKSKGKIIIKNAGEGIKKFKVEGGKLTKDSTGVDAELKSKLEEFNKQLETVKAPDECRFDENEKEESFECGVTPDDLKTMVFKKDQGDLTYKNGEGFTGMKLKVQIIKTVDSNAKEKVSDMFLTFKDYSETVKLEKGNKEEIVSLIKNTNPEFEIHDDDEEKESDSNLIVLTKKWKPDSFEDLLNLSCTSSDGNNKWECMFTKESKEINLGKGTGEEFEKLTMENISGKNFELYKDQENYNQGFKFVYTGEKVSGTGGSPTLEKDSNYEFRWKIQNQNNNSTKIGYLVKKNPQ